MDQVLQHQFMATVLQFMAPVLLHQYMAIALQFMAIVLPDTTQGLAMAKKLNLYSSVTSAMSISLL